MHFVISHPCANFKNSFTKPPLNLGMMTNCIYVFYMGEIIYRWPCPDADLVNLNK